MQFTKGHSQSHAVPGLKWALVALSLVVLTCVCTVTAYAAHPQISKIAVKNLADSVQITISSGPGLACYDSRLGDHYLVFDLYGKLAPREQKRISIHSGGINMVRAAWYKDSPPVARVVVGTTALRNYTIHADPKHAVTTITVRKPGAVAKKPVPAAKPSPVEKPVPGGAVEPATEPEPASEIASPVEAAPAAAPVRMEKPVITASAAPVMMAQAVIAPKAPKLISLDFVASDIHDVLKALSAQGGVNVVASPDVKGNVTVSLSKVTVEEALKLIANISGYKYQYVDGTYVVGTAENVRALAAGSGEPEETVTEVVMINYADPAAILKMVSTQIPGVNTSSSGGDAKNAKGPAVLVFTGSKSLAKAAKALAETVEQSFAQSMDGAVTELYEVKYADITQLSTMLVAAVPALRVIVGPEEGFNLQCPAPVEMGSSSGSGSSGGSSYSGSATQQKVPSKIMLLQGDQSDIEKAKALLAKIDIPQPQIMIEAKVVDISDTGANDLGIKWGGESNLTSTRLDETPGGQAISIGRFDRNLVPFSIDASIQAVVESGKGKVLANPNVLALDGKPASAFIGDEVKYVVRIDQTLQGGTTVTTETARVGVQLHTISRISPDGYITMDLHPEVSVITDWMDVPAAGLSLPLISRRFIDSTIRVKDGETIVIGGLIKDEEIKSMSGVPFLKDLPFIGQLFKSRSTKASHSEIMMFITPRLMPNK